MESKIQDLCQIYLRPSSEAAASDYKRAKEDVLESYPLGSPEKELAREIFSAQEESFLAPRRDRCEQLFDTVRNAFNQGTVDRYNFIDPLTELGEMVNVFKCVASTSTANHLLQSGLGAFIRKAVCHFASRMPEDDTSNIILCLCHLGIGVCTTPDNSANVLGDDKDFARAIVTLLRCSTVDFIAATFLWALLESYSHQAVVLAAEQHVVEHLYNVLVPGDSDWDKERNDCVIGCLACLARNPQCLQSMMDLDMPSTLLQWIKDPSQSMECFFACIALAHLTTNWVVAYRSRTNASSTSSTCTSNDKFNLPKSLELGLRMLNIWVTQKISVEELYEKTRIDYLWHSLRPFLDLLRSVFLEARRLASLSLAFILQGSENRDILFEEVGRHCGILQCASWSRDEEVRRYSRMTMDHAASDGTTPPRLEDMCAFRVSEDYYSKYANSRLPSAWVSNHVVNKLVTPFSMTLV